MIIKGLSRLGAFILLTAVGVFACGLEDLPFKRSRM